jgi:hypothetical protein
VDLLDLLDGPPVPNEDINHDRDKDIVDDTSMYEADDEKRSNSISPTKNASSKSVFQGQCNCFNFFDVRLMIFVATRDLITRRQIERTLEDYQADLFKNLNGLLENIEARVVLGFSKAHSSLQITAPSETTHPDTMLQIEATFADDDQHQVDEKEQEQKAEQEKIFARPPHDKLFFPCGFNDCIYCSIRSLCESTLHKLDKEVDSLISSYSTIPEGDEADGEVKNQS